MTDNNGRWAQTPITWINGLAGRTERDDDREARQEPVDGPEHQPGWGCLPGDPQRAWPALSCDCAGAYHYSKCKHQTAVAEKLAAETQIVAVDQAKVAMARSLGMLK